MVQHLLLLELFDDEALYTEIYDAATLIYVITLNSQQYSLIKQK